jgi:hypothetical protein
MLGVVHFVSYIYRYAFATKSARAANAMNVILTIRGQVVINDQGHLLDINASCPNVGGNEDTPVNNQCKSIVKYREEICRD